MSTEAPETTAESNEADKPAETEKAPTYCACGCGGATNGKSKFVQGHDQKLKAVIATAAVDGTPLQIGDETKPDPLAYAREVFSEAGVGSVQKMIDRRKQIASEKAGREQAAAEKKAEREREAAAKKELLAAEKAAKKAEADAAKAAATPAATEVDTSGDPEVGTPVVGTVGKRSYEGTFEGRTDDGKYKIKNGNGAVKIAQSIQVKTS